jgi:hypothetical protein
VGTAADEFNAQSNGKLRLIVDGENYLLRRPKIGELRELEEAITEIGAAERAELVAAAAEERAARDFTQEILAWWRRVVTLLEESGKTLPDVDDDLPAWMLNATLLGDARVVWREVPYGPGGQPTRKALQMATQMARQAS